MESPYTLCLFTGAATVAIDPTDTVTDLGAVSLQFAPEDGGRLFAGLYKNRSSNDWQAGPCVLCSMSDGVSSVFRCSRNLTALPFKAAGS